ncbi:MAG: SpoIIE family protein phosphatase [Anaerolineales bacterium]
MFEFLGELRVEATRENLRTISFFIQGLGQRLRLDESTLFDLELAVEEAATNIISHAYSDQHDGAMALHADLIGNSLRMTISDWGRSFDPASVRPFDIHAPVETRIQGGMGLHFIHNLMDGVERHISTGADDPNRLTLIKTIQTRGRSAPLRLRQTQELSAMQTISTVLTSGIELDQLLRIIIDKLVETIGAERGTLYMVDEERGECWSRVLLEDAAVLPEIRIKIGEGIAGTVAQTGETLNIPEAHAHPLFNPSFDHETGYTTRNILAVPMRDPRQKVIGVVQMLNKRDDDAFTAQDARLLSAMAAQAAISIENARLYEQELAQKLVARELETAHGIQKSFLPEHVPEVLGWEIAAYWEPMSNVAGDFYDFRVLPDGRLVAAIADVSGKGIPAALLMAMCVTLLRFGLTLGLTPRELIANANHALIEQQRSRMFATLFIAYITPEDGQVAYVSAGHNPPLLYRAQTGACDLLSAAGVAVGIFKAAQYEQKSAQMAPGDILVMYTDGITEIINEAEEEFGEERLQTLICDHASASPSEIVARIREAVHGFSGSPARFDDETLVIIKRQTA